MSFGRITQEYLVELGEEIRNLGYPQYSHEQQFSLAETENAIRLKDIIHHIGQLNLSNSLAQEKLALEDIPTRCFVTEKSGMQSQNSIILSESGAILIRTVYLSESMAMVGWISPGRKLHVRILEKSDGIWTEKVAKQITADNVQGFDLAVISPNVVIIGYTLGLSQGFQRLDINNGIIREHGLPTIISSSNNEIYNHIKLWLIKDQYSIKFRYFIWGHSDGEYGKTFSNILMLDPYDEDLNGTTQTIKSRGSEPGNNDILHVQRGQYGLNNISYTSSYPYALCVQPLTNTEFFIARIGANFNVLTEVCRNVNGLWWVVPTESAGGIVNGATAVTAVIATSSKAVVCYNGQNAVWGVVAPLRSTQRPQHQKLLTGNFSRVKLTKLTADTYCLAAYGEGASSNDSTLLKFKVDVNNNSFSTIYSYQHSGFGSADMVFMDNINIMICANQYNSQTQTSKLVGQPHQLNLGVKVAKPGEPIAGVSSRAALQGNYVSVEMVRPEQ